MIFARMTELTFLEQTLVALPWDYNFFFSFCHKLYFKSLTHFEDAKISPIRN